MRSLINHLRNLWPLPFDILPHIFFIKAKCQRPPQTAESAECRCPLSSLWRAGPNQVCSYLRSNAFFAKHPPLRQELFPKRCWALLH